MGDEYNRAEAEAYGLGYAMNVPRGGYSDTQGMYNFLNPTPPSVREARRLVEKFDENFPQVKEMGQKMRTNEDLITEAENLRQQAERLEEIAAQRERYGEDPFRNGTVLKVDMKYRTGNRSYAYAVIKVGGKFYLSGRMSGPSTMDLNVITTADHSRGYTWEQFVAWLAQGDATVWQASGLKQVL